MRAPFPGRSTPRPLRLPMSIGMGGVLLLGSVWLFRISLTKYAGSYRPVLLGFMGWDAGINALWQAGVRDIPRFNGVSPTGMFTAALTLLAALVLAGVPLIHGRSARTTRGGAWFAAAHRAVPVALLVTAWAFVLLDFAGLWSRWFVKPTGLIHYGHRIDQARGLNSWFGLLAVWLICTIALRLSCRHASLRSWILVAARGLIAAAASFFIFSLVLDTQPRYGGARHLDASFTAIVLSLFAGWWCLGLTTLLLLWPPRPIRRAYRWDVERYRRPGCLACGYDLRGTVAADRDTCPECGMTIPSIQQRFITATMKTHHDDLYDHLVRTAQHLVTERGWPWESPVFFSDAGEHVVVSTAVGTGRDNVVVMLDKSTGQILSADYGPHPDSHDAFGFGPRPRPDDDSQPCSRA